METNTLEQTTQTRADQVQADELCRALADILLRVLNEAKQAKGEHESGDLLEIFQE
ncbi:MAG: hypothetical protein JW934_20845 [Anaerolineae bacterium]|nr:hypothetical protein [Anaerolineae bacterium]